MSKELIIDASNDALETAEEVEADLSRLWRAAMACEVDEGRNWRGSAGRELLGSICFLPSSLTHSVPPSVPWPGLGGSPAVCCQGSFGLPQSPPSLPPSLPHSLRQSRPLCCHGGFGLPHSLTHSLTPSCPLCCHGSFGLPPGPARYRLNCRDSGSCQFSSQRRLQ